MIIQCFEEKSLTGSFRKVFLEVTECKTMTQEELKVKIAQGESSTLQFKSNGVITKR